MSRFAEGVFIVAALAGAEVYAGSHPVLPDRPDSYAVSQARQDHGGSAALPAFSESRTASLPVVLPALRPTVARAHRSRNDWTDHVLHESPVQKRLHPGVYRHPA